MNLTFSDVKELKRRNSLHRSLLMSLSTRSVNEYQKWNKRLKQRNEVDDNKNKDVNVNNEKVIEQLNKKLRCINEEIKENKEVTMMIKMENEIKSKCGINNINEMKKWIKVFPKRYNHFNLNAFVKFNRNKSK